jgi:spore germination protein GerM
VPLPVEAPVSIFLVTSAGRLVAVAREVPAAQESLATVISALVRGPTNFESLAGLESALPAQTKVLSAVTAATGIATINLGGTFDQLVGQPQIQAAAQIVFTATALPGVSGVAFELDGHAVGVPVASGAQVPVANRAQFAPLAPVPA